MASNSIHNSLIENQLIGRDNAGTRPLKRKNSIPDGNSTARKKTAFVTPSEKEKDPQYNESFVFNTEAKKISFSLDNRAYAMTSIASLPLDVTNIDTLSTRTTSYDPTYASVVFKNKFSNECKSLIHNRIILGRYQHEIPKKSYMILCNFLSEVSMDNALQTSTFVLCVQLLDRLLSMHQFKIAEIQLVGCACLLIASKLEDIYPPTADGLVYSSGNSFDKLALFKTEVEIMKLLEFKVFVPTRYDFGTRFGVVAGLTKKEQSLVNYLIEISIQDYDFFNRFAPSKVAAAALHLTIQMTRDMNVAVWSPTVQYYTTYAESELTELVMTLAQLRWDVENSRMKHTVTKYSMEEYQAVACITAIPIQNLRFDSKEAKEIAKLRVSKVMNLAAASGVVVTTLNAATLSH